MLFPRLAVLLPATLLAAGCATTSPLRQMECTAPDVQLATLLGEYDALSPAACNANEHTECASLRSQIERLSLACPTHAASAFALAVLAYDDGDGVRAQQYLDRLLARPEPAPEVAVLRARLAIEDGNLPFARRLLDQQLRLSPDSAGLHEMRASVLFLGREFDAAGRELEIADRLGAPRWRVAYHLGLIAETQARLADAKRLFQEAAAENPGWSGAAARLRALEAMPDSPPDKTREP